MTSFELYIDDGRYSVPQLAFISADSADAAVEIAKAMMRENPNYLAVELRRDDAWLFSQTATAEPPA